MPFLVRLHFFSEDYGVKEVMAATAGDIGTHFHGDIVGMIMGAGIMVQFVLLLLLCFSIISWAIIFAKYRTIRKIEKENDLFLEIYMRATKLSEISPRRKNLKIDDRRGIPGRLYRARKIRKEKGGADLDDSGITNVEIRGIDNVERALNRASTSEITRVENMIGFLATTGSSCPFIGLFGTVWGIMTAFRGIGARGTASLAVVAPGISEALIATAAGLAAAIPAVIFFNYFQNRIKKVSSEMDNFSSEFLNIIERYYVKLSGV